MTFKQGIGKIWQRNRKEMKQRTKIKRGRAKKKEWMAGAGLLAYLIGLLIRIPLGRMIGDKGIGFLATGMEVYLVVSIVLAYGISKAVTVQVKYRVKREMYKSAGRVYRTAMFLATAGSALAAAGIFVFAENIAEILLLEHLGYMAVAAAAPAVCLGTMIGVLRGYFQGMGTMLPSVHSRLLEKFVMLAASLIAASVFYEYGRKVAALLRHTEYAPAYGAMGAALGVSVAAAFGLLHLLFIRMAYAGTFKQQQLKDTSKYEESKIQIISMLITTSLPYMLCALLYNMNDFADQRLFNYAMNLKEQAALRTAHWGVYYGKYSVVTGGLAILCTLWVLTRIPKILQSYERQERREAQQRFAKAVHGLAVLAIPCAVWTAVLAEVLTELLFKEDIATAVRLLQTGSFVIVLFPFAYLFMNLLQRIRRMRIVILAGLAAFMLHLAVLMLLLNGTALGILAVACAGMVFWLVICVTGLLSVGRAFQYAPNWIRSFGVPLIAACVSGLAGMLMSRLLLTLAGALVTLPVCLLLCLAVYNVLLLLLRGITEDELMELPGGRVILALAERVRLI